MEATNDAPRISSSTSTIIPQGAQTKQIKIFLERLLACCLSPEALEIVKTQLEIDATDPESFLKNQTLPKEVHDFISTQTEAEIFFENIYNDTESFLFNSEGRDSLLLDMALWQSSQNEASSSISSLLCKLCIAYIKEINVNPVLFTYPDAHTLLEAVILNYSSTLINASNIALTAEHLRTVKELTEKLVAKNSNKA